MRDLTDEVRELFNRMFGNVAPELIFDAFPDRVVLLQDTQLRVYQVNLPNMIDADVWGLVCLSQEFIGDAFIAALDRKDLHPVEMSFDEARDLAKSKNVPCLLLLDDPDQIIVHWVK